MTDEEIITEVLSGRIESFALLVDRYRDRIFRFILQRVGQPQEAEDLAQEVFIAAYRSLNKFRREAKFSTWLHGIALNQVRNCIRRSHNRRHFLLSEAVLRKTAAAQYRSESRNPVSIKELIRAVDALPVKLREPLVMAVFDDLSYREIAGILDLPSGTVKSRIFRARERVKRIIKKNE